MELKLQMRKMLRKHGSTSALVVLEEVAFEERVHHDMLGCRNCYIDPHNGHIVYCPLSVYNLTHPSHICLMGVLCSCDEVTFQ